MLRTEVVWGSLDDCVSVALSSDSHAESSGIVRLVRDDPLEFELVILLESVTLAENEAEAAADVNEESVEGRLTSGSIVMSIVSHAPASLSGLALRVLSPNPPASLSVLPERIGGVGTRKEPIGGVVRDSSEADALLPV
jgi:hypothetical protein